MASFLKCSSLILIIITIITPYINANGYNLKELKSNNIPSDPITTNPSKLHLIKYTSQLFLRANGIRNGFWGKKFGANKGQMYSQKPEEKSSLFIPRLVHTPQEQIDRMRPQYIITYYPPLQSIVVFIVGTFMKSLKFDWTNAINVVPQEIKLTQQYNHPIEVHQGVYNAINTPLFYEQFLSDLQLIITNVHKQHFQQMTADQLFHQKPIKGTVYHPLLFLQLQSDDNS